MNTFIYHGDQVWGLMGILGLGCLPPKLDSIKLNNLNARAPASGLPALSLSHDKWPVAGLCTNCGHWHDTINVVDSSTPVAQLTILYGDSGLTLPHDVEFPLNDSILLGGNGQDSFLPFGYYNPLPSSDGAFPHVDNLMGQEGQLTGQYPFPVAGNSQSNDFTLAMVNPAVAGDVTTAPAPTAIIEPAPHQRVHCRTCPKTFSRASDLRRHITSVHKIGPQALHLCTIPGCPKSIAPGYSRRDKVVDHLRKVHGL
ncbi:hypothetical protein ACMFMG_005505 [Clarireedia jacksonii]